MRKRHLWLSSSQLLMTKEQQEEHVGEVLATEYEKISGAALLGNDKSPRDPPDRIFTWRGVKVGAEMFELEQFHESTAFFDALAGEAYDAFRAKVADKRLVGLVVQVHLRAGMAPSERMTIAPKLKKDLRKAGAEVAAIGENLADLVLASVGDRDLSRDIHWRTRVDQSSYPALASISEWISFGSTRPDYPGSEEHLPHLVPLGAGLYMDGAESTVMVDRIMQQIQDKIEDRERWLAVDHSILVAHDVSRTRLGIGLDEYWPYWVRVAAKEIDVLCAFDELWLVTAWRYRSEADGGSVGEPNGAVRIAGRSPSLKAPK